MDSKRVSAFVIVIAALLTGGCTQRFKCSLIPWALAVDPSAGAAEDGDAMLEPGEEVTVRPQWKAKNVLSSTSQPCPASVTGKASDWTGPSGADYGVGEGTTGYASTGAMRNCSACYALSVSGPAHRPAPHWDASLQETLSGNVMTSIKKYETTWTVHVGGSFKDVPKTNPFYKKVETLFHNGVTSGCGPKTFCPDATLDRAQIAIFVAKTLAHGEENLPDSGTVGAAAYACVDGGHSLFVDVQPTDSFCRHVHYLAAQNVDHGCAEEEYCPDDLVSRLDMAAFVARGLVAPQGKDGVPETYSDATTGLSYSCDAASPNLHFTDTPATGPYCSAAHYLWARGIVGGCAPDLFCASGAVARAPMAKFLVNAFSLKLYGP
jgi:S-layer family protein